VKRLLGTLLLAGALGLPVLGAEYDPGGQIRPITPPAEQRIEPLNPPGEQQVQALSPDEAQRVSEGTKSPSGRAANGVAKVFIGILAAGISLAAMAASLLFI
jgi:hypothetical protein